MGVGRCNTENVLFDPTVAMRMAAGSWRAAGGSDVLIM